jgi:hypothetical protein
MAKRKAGSQIGNWLSTTKNWESPQFPRVKVACNILLETSRWGLQLFLRPHLNRRFARKVMGPQSCKSLNCENFHLGVPETKWHLGASLVARHRTYYKREGIGIPQVWAMLNLVNRSLPMVHPNTKSALAMH